MSTHHQDARIGYANALRVTAIAAVVMYHIFLNSSAPISYAKFGWLGLWGVDTFFVLTGYLLSGPFLAAVVERKPMPNVKRYAERRFLRIYPLYLVAVIVSAALWFAALHNPFSLGTVLSHIIFLQDIRPAYAYQLNGPLWTMSVDVAFYISLPIVAWVLDHAVKHADRAARVRVIWIFFAVVAVGAVAERIVALRMFAHSDDFWHVTVLARNVVGSGFDFAFGGAIAFAEYLYPARRIRGDVRFALLALGAASFAALVLAPKFLPEHTLGVPIGWVVLDPLAGIATAAFLTVLLRTRWPLAERLCESAPITQAAVLAYGIYLFHEPLLLWYRHAHPHEIGRWRDVLPLLGVLLFAVVPIAYVAHRFVERPFLQLKQRRREVTPTLP